ncbi:MAG: ROK family protein [Candidatus Lokiarchaeota archaeon]|nr:ROK family protein [Candidatus Lokiarchaeota archaeon]
MRIILEKYIAGCDIGGTWVRVAICKLELKDEEIIIKKERTLKEDKYSISSQICKLLKDLIKEKSLKREQLLGIGLATAGPVDIGKGILFNNANLGFREIPLKNPIKEKFPEIPLYLINDGNAGVIGVHYFEALEKEKNNLAYITMSTGIGGGVICNGNLLLGKDGNATEIGHLILQPNSKYLCNCRAYGCWEVFSSGTGIKNRTIDAFHEGKLNGEKLLKLVKNNKSNITAKEVFQAARDGDKLSLKIIDNCVLYSKIGVGSVNNNYDCESIYFGGALIENEEQIITPLRKQFKNDPIKYTVNRPPNIKISKYKSEIGIRGALAYIKYILQKNSVVAFCSN